MTKPIAKKRRKRRDRDHDIEHIDEADYRGDEAFAIRDILRAPSLQAARQAYAKAYGRKLNDKNVGAYLKKLLSFAVNRDTLEIPARISVAAYVLSLGAKKAHGRPLRGSREPRRWRDDTHEVEALRQGVIWWDELKADNEKDPKRQAAKRVHDRLLPTLSVEAIYRRMRCSARDT